MATSAFTRRITAAQAVQNVMTALALDVPENVFDSQDASAVLLRFLLTRAGQKLITENNWEFLQREQTITTVPGQRTYPMPEDFDSYVMDSQWNRTTRLPAIGSLTEPEWQMLMARQLAGTTFTMLFRIIGDVVEFYNTPSTVQTIVFPYIGRGWVAKEDNSRADWVSENSDVVLYDRQLTEAALRLEWDIEKRFDTSSAVQAYNNALRAAKMKDKPGRTLTLDQTAAYPYLGVINMPDTNYGS